MLVPKFTMNNYTPLMDVEFSSGENEERISLWDVFMQLQPPFTTTYGQRDVRQLTSLLQSTSVANKGDLIALKLLCPTLWSCDYFFWNVGVGTHMGIDIIMPHKTPISSFTDGEVVRIKVWDGTAQNEGNCVVVKATDGYKVSYEHLDSIDVAVGQHVKQGDQIGLCGTTGNSTQYHLHLQVDKGFAPFHPYWSADLDEIKQYTIDPLPYLRARSPVSQYLDMPQQDLYKDAITVLTKALIIKGFDRHIFPEKLLMRYEAALMIDRVLRLYALYDTLSVKTPSFAPYSDTNLGDSELDEALMRLQRYGVMKGHGGSFYPKKHLVGEELLALLGRIFYKLTDNEHGYRYQNYLSAFQDEGIIGQQRNYVGKSVPRKEVFLLLSILLQRKGIV